MRPNARFIVLLALLLALVAVVVYEWQRMTSPAGVLEPAAASGDAARPARRSTVPAAATVPTVRLDALQAARSQPAPAAGERNPFQFQPKMPPPSVAGRGPAGTGNGGPGGATVPTPPPPPPPIPVKFVGIVETPGKKLAVLADSSTKDVFYGREGDVIDGRYRILRIGVESIEMAYVDGRGRQTIRLTGS